MIQILEGIIDKVNQEYESHTLDLKLSILEYVIAAGLDSKLYEESNKEF